MTNQDEAVERIIGRQPYTPSLDEGREAYVVAMTRNHDSYLMGVSLAEARAVHGQDFDRMIEAVRAEEREKAARIAVTRADALVRENLALAQERDRAREAYALAVVAGDKAEHERDEALAVIERAKGWAERRIPGFTPENQMAEVADALASSPPAALDAVKAEAWDEGFDAGERDVFEHEKRGWGDERCIPNPYRKGTDRDRDV